jgi:hypothetical protein
MSKSAPCPESSSDENGFRNLLVTRPCFFSSPDMALDTVRALSRVSDANRDEFLHLPGKSALLLKNFVVKVFESLEHLLLGFLKVFVVLPTVRGIKVFRHMSLLSYKA